MPRTDLGVEPMNVTVLPKHRDALDAYAAAFGYPGRSAAIRRIIERSPELQPYLVEEEPTPCPQTP